MANYNRSQNENDWGDENSRSRDSGYENERNYIESRRQNQSGSGRNFDYDYVNDRMRNRGQSSNNPDYDRQTFGAGQWGDTDWDFNQNRSRSGGNWVNEGESNRGSYGSDRSQGSAQGDYGRYRDRGFRAGGSGDYYGRDRQYTGSDFQQDFGGPSSESYDYGRRSGWGENDSAYGRGSASSWGGNNDNSNRSGGQSGSQHGSRSSSGSMNNTNQRGEHYGRGPQGYQRSDDRIREDINDRLTWHGEVDATMITVNVSKGEVTLEGTVPHRYQKRVAEDIAEEVQGVTDVQNRLRVQSHSDEGGMTGGSGSKRSGSTTSTPTSKKSNERENDKQSAGSQLQNGSLRERPSTN